MRADVDLDFANREDILKLIQHTPARQSNGKKHNSGVYVTDIPYDPVNECSTLEYEHAEQRGYFKIDFLNMSVYQLVKDPAHYKSMLTAKPPWERLWQDSEWARQLVHVGNYSHLLETMRPDSITRMAAFISIIRPGKAHLQNLPWSDVFASVWDGDNSRGFVFKKSHAISYSMLVMLHMNLLVHPAH
jgi:hypothetical protein